MTEHNILINRAPVLTLWATTVAERLGFDQDEALSLGKAVAGLNAQSKGQRLGIFKPVSHEVKRARARKRGEEFFIEIFGRQDGWPTLSRFSVDEPPQLGDTTPVRLRRVTGFDV